MLASVTKGERPRHPGRFIDAHCSAAAGRGRSVAPVPVPKKRQPHNGPSHAIRRGTFVGVGGAGATAARSFARAQEGTRVLLTWRFLAPAELASQGPTAITVPLQ